MRSHNLISRLSAAFIVCFTACLSLVLNSCESPEPEAVLVQSISVSQPSISVKEGETANIVFTVKPDNATNKTVTFTSSNTAVATVDANGKVTAVAAGTATITATTNDGGKTASCTVTVSEAYTPVTAIQGKGKILLNPTRYSLTYGTDYTVTPADATYKDPSDFNWTASDSKFTVDENGNTVGGEMNGQVDITATSKRDGVSAVVRTVIIPSFHYKVINSTDPLVPVGKTYDDLENIRVTVGTRVDLQLINEHSAQTDNAFQTAPYTLKARGTSEQIAKSSARTNESGKSYISIAGVAVGGASYELTYQGKDNSEGEECDAVISTILSVISAHITALEIVLTPETLSLQVGETGTLTATVQPENATDKTLGWRSDNTSIATVDDQGNVTAIAPGTANIYVWSQQNSDTYASCKVTVTEAYTPVTAIQGKGKILLNPTRYSLTYGTDYTVTPADATYKDPSDFNWTASDSKFTVDENGNTVGGEMNGQVDITATSKRDGVSAVVRTVIIPSFHYKVINSTDPLVPVGKTYDDLENIRVTVGTRVDLQLINEHSAQTDNAFQTAPYTLKARGTSEQIAKSSARTNESGKSYISIAGVAVGGASYELTYQGKDNSEGEECDAVISTILSVISAHITALEIVLTPETLSLQVGETGTLTATVQPENATDKTLGWRSDNTSIATVDDQGNVTAIAPGTVNIYVGSQQNTDAYASCKVTVSEAYTPITAIQGKGTLLLGVATTYDMAYGTDYTVTPSDATYKEPSDFNWTSSNPGNLSVTSTGRIGTGLRNSITDISISSKHDNVEGVIRTVICVPYYLKVLASNTSDIQVGATFNNNDNVRIPVGAVIDFQLINEHSTNLDNAFRTGSYTLRARNSQSTSLTAHNDNNGQNYFTMEAKEVGSAGIYVTYQGKDMSEGQEYDAYISTPTYPFIIVPPLVTGIVLDKSEMVVSVGESATLIATVQPENAQNKSISWSTSNANVAVVDQQGNVTGKADGVATISAKTVEGGFIASCQVTVLSSYTPVTSLRGNDIPFKCGHNTSSPSLTLGYGDDYYTNSDASFRAPENFEWKSSNTSVATVSNGKVTINTANVGSCDIYAKPKYGSLDWVKIRTIQVVDYEIRCTYSTNPQGDYTHTGSTTTLPIKIKKGYLVDVALYDITNNVRISPLIYGHEEIYSVLPDEPYVEIRSYTNNELEGARLRIQGANRGNLTVLITADDHDTSFSSECPVQVL